jgi:uncharacterized protein
MLRVTADTNIYVSALAIGGKPMHLLHLANIGQIELAVSDAILDEIARVLARPKLDWAAERIAEARAVISSLAHHVTPSQLLDVVKDDPADNKVLECAVESGTFVIVSGDKHLLRLKSYRGIEIMTVGEFLTRERIHSRIL